MTATKDLPFDARVSGRVRDLLAAEGMEVCHMEWKPAKRRGVLVLYVDRVGGVSLDDCARASGIVGDLLDAEAPEMPAYTLEVSSPGLDRPLWTIDDCRRFAGRRVTVRLHQAVSGTSRLKGPLESVAGESLTVLDEDSGRRYTIQFGDVRLARLVPEF